MRPANDDDPRERCIACIKAFETGEQFYPDLSGGFIHAACCDPEGFVNMETGAPLARRPYPSIWRDAT